MAAGPRLGCSSKCMKPPLSCHLEFTNQLLDGFYCLSSDQNGNYNMNRSDLHTRLSELHPQLPSKDVELSVKVILDAISTALSRGGRAEIRDFGCFDLNYRAPREGRNPKNGDKVKVSAKYVPHFKAGKELRERVGQTGSGSFSTAVFKNFQPAGFLKTASRVE